MCIIIQGKDQMKQMSFSISSKYMYSKNQYTFLCTADEPLLM